MADTICVKGAILYLPHSYFYIDVNLLKAETWHFNAVSIILFTTKPEESLDANVKTQEWRNVFVQCQKVTEKKKEFGLSCLFSCSACGK